MQPKLHTMIDVLLFSEIVSGKLNPSLKKYNIPNNLTRLIFQAQTQKVLLGNDDELSDFDSSIYGFKNQQDCRIKKVNTKNTKTYEIALIPTKIYELQEDFSMPEFPSPKVNTFISLITDEFERIKTRAEQKHDLLTSDKQLNFYCKKNLQKVKKIFHDAKNCLDKSNHNENLDDFFILFVLCQFLIRTILFYQKHFKHFIDFRLDEAQELYAELYAKALNGNLEFIFKYGLIGFQASEKRSQKNEKGLNSFENDLETILNNGESEFCMCGQLKKVGWYGQINTLIDALEQVFWSQHTNETKGSTVVRDLIQAIICVCFYKNGIEPMSPNSIRTTTNINRIDKRLKEDSPKRLHISIKEQ